MRIAGIITIAMVVVSITLKTYFMVVGRNLITCCAFMALALDNRIVYTTVKSTLIDKLTQLNNYYHFQFSF